MNDAGKFPYDILESRENAKQPSGQRLAATEATGDQWTYGYDSRKQLTTAMSRGLRPTGPNGLAGSDQTDSSEAVIGTQDNIYAYDPIGNRLNATEAGAGTTYAANALNQYATVNAGMAKRLLDDGNGHVRALPGGGYTNIYLGRATR